jgi:hypothetical protein
LLLNAALYWRIALSPLCPCGIVESCTLRTEHLLAQRPSREVAYLQARDASAASRAQNLNRCARFN